MKCKVCEKPNHEGRGEEHGESILLRSGVYLTKDHPAYFCLKCAQLLSDAYAALVKAGGVCREYELDEDGTIKRVE